MTVTDQLPTPVVRVSSTGSAFTTSTDVAAFFDKRHSHVLRAIEGLLCDLREHIQWPNRADVDDQSDAGAHQPKIGLMGPEDLFEAADVEVSIGSGAVRRDPIYNLSRDGFALLAMGFTGKQALAFKLAYISAFNTMEAKLRQPYVAPLAEDLEFARGLRVKDKVMLHEQAYKASRALSTATNEDERRQAYWQLYQVNTTLGVPMPTMEALGVEPLATGNRLPRSR
ncbi:Rha family transcriptional regulator [Stenotrophomonas maltophilia]|uniref:Rha family transcriptional regulator n=1 Tax=Stenotrophomonas maltophilia TaxID=40324 RepID=UPI0034DB52C2